MKLEFTKDADGQRQRTLVAVQQLVIGGWTGRDKEALAHHIEELKSIGVAPPTTTPCFYRCSIDLLTTETKLQVLGPDSAGEVEFVLFLLDDGLWVTVGSDHTDRRVEAYSIAVSKQLCPHPVAPILWRFDEIEKHWDRLMLRSYIREQGRDVLYQEGAVTTMLHPNDLLAAYRRAGGEVGVGTVMFGGTLSAIGGIRPSGQFTCELEDPVRGRRVTHSYATECLPIV